MAVCAPGKAAAARTEVIYNENGFTRSSRVKRARASCSMNHEAGESESILDPEQDDFASAPNPSAAAV